MWEDKDIVGNFADYRYWSSGEDYPDSAWFHYFNYGVQVIDYKYLTSCVRPVRNVKQNEE